MKNTSGMIALVDPHLIRYHTSFACWQRKKGKCRRQAQGCESAAAGVAWKRATHPIVRGEHCAAAPIAGTCIARREGGEEASFRAAWTFLAGPRALKELYPPTAVDTAGGKL